MRQTRVQNPNAVKLAENSEPNVVKVEENPEPECSQTSGEQRTLMQSNLQKAVQGTDKPPVQVKSCQPDKSPSDSVQGSVKSCQPEKSPS